jgi:hypothetical protein
MHTDMAPDSLKACRANVIAGLALVVLAPHGAHSNTTEPTKTRAASTGFLRYELLDATPSIENRRLQPRYAPSCRSSAGTQTSIRPQTLIVGTWPALAASYAVLRPIPTIAAYSGTVTVARLRQPAGAATSRPLASPCSLIVALSL